MSASNPAAAGPPPTTELFGSYELLAPLGEGGMGEVFRARHRDGRELALKRLRVPERARDQARIAALFEREYHTLAELAHPRIIEVHDYGVHAEVPYYTMELLDGRDLRERAPVPWREACALLRDVASSLSLLHSRRLVHRDLSPRNVRCTGDGRAKLLDFGGLAPMGGGQPIVGTPAYVAPELLHGQPVDGRADLFGLGALAYWTLTGRHAFPARGFRDLADAWRTRPPPPSRRDASIPRELDALVMQLLNVEPAARPQSAAEVIARLNAVGDLAPDESLDVARAYLVAPALVGRDEIQLEFRKRALAAIGGRGSSQLVQGPERCGRTRLLETFVIEAKLAGMAVLWAARDEGDGAERGLLTALVAELMATEPELAMRAARSRAELLSPLLPELELQLDDGAERDIEPGDPRCSAAVASWLLEIAHARPLAILVDDLDRCDLPSAAVVTRLAAQANEHAPLVIVASGSEGEGGVASRAVAQFAEHASRTPLGPLDQAQTRALLESVFGSAAHLDQAAAWAQQLGEGLPGATMALAQHLADSGVARFAEGHWSLPERLEGLALPESFDRVLDMRVECLGAAARMLAQLLSLLRPHASLTLQQCLELLQGRHEHREAYGAIDELVRAGVLTASDTSYCVHDRTLLQAVLRSMDADTRSRLHRMLAAHYERMDDNLLEVAYHLFEAGDPDAALATTIEVFTVGELDFGGHNTIFGRTQTGISLLEKLLAHGRDNGMAPGKLYPVQKILVQLAAAHDARLGHYALEVLPQLKADSGWIYWDECPDLPALERVGKCFDRAQAAFDACDERRRGLPPLSAIKELASTAAVLNAIGSRTADTEHVYELPALLEPFVELAPAIQILHDICCQARDSTAVNLHVFERRQHNIDRLVEPVGGMDELTRLGALHILSYYHGLEAALACNAQALELADGLEHTPSYVPLAWQVRMVYHLACTRQAEAARCRHHRDLAALQRIESDQHIVRSIGHELLLALRSGDLLTIKRVLPQLERQAALFEGWRVWLHYGRACYAWVRDDARGARQACERGLAAMQPTGHLVRSHLEGLLVRALLRCDERERARELALGLEARIPPERGEHRDPVPVAVALALTQAAEGDVRGGHARLDALAAKLRERSAVGITLAYVHEQQAWLALEHGDAALLEGALCAMASAIGDDSNLRAKLEHLAGEARRRGLPAADPLGLVPVEPVTIAASDDATSHTVVTMLAGGDRRADRAARVLALLVERSNALGGHLFALDGDEPVLFASEGLSGPTAQVRQAVRERASGNLDSGLQTATLIDGGTADATRTGVTSVAQDGMRLHAFTLCGGGRREGLPVGVLMLACEDDRVPLVSHDTLRALGAGLGALREA